MNQVPTTIDKMNTMNAILLTDVQKYEMAAETYKIRKGFAPEDKVEIDNQTINDLLTPLRAEDEGNSLWNVFNVLQEKMIKGGFSATGKNGKVRKQRPISSIKKDVEYNQRLWKVASQYMASA